MGKRAGDRRSPQRWLPAVLAGASATVAAALAVATTVATSLIPATLHWAHNPAIAWAVVAALAVLAAILATAAVRSDSNPSHAHDPPQVSEVTTVQEFGDVRGPVITDAREAVSTRSRFVYIDQRQAGPSPAAAPVALSTRQVVVGDIPAQPVAYVPRDEVDQLASAWEGDRKVTLVQAVVGGRGVGKTQAAGAYARARAEQGWPVVAWVPAETPDQLVVRLADLAQALGVADPEGDSLASARNARRWLETCAGPALMVFDNAADPDAVRSFVPSLGPVHVVITSTDQSFAGLGSAVEVGLFSQEQSRAYLRQRTGIEDEAGAARVAEELGRLPLALAQAAAVIAQQRLSTPPTWTDSPGCRSTRPSSVTPASPTRSVRRRQACSLSRRHKTKTPPGSPG